MFLEELCHLAQTKDISYNILSHLLPEHKSDFHEKIKKDTVDSISFQSFQKQYKFWLNTYCMFIGMLSQYMFSVKAKFQTFS